MLSYQVKESLRVRNAHALLAIPGSINLEMPLDQSVCPALLIPTLKSRHICSTPRACGWEDGISQLMRDKWSPFTSCFCS